MESAVDKVLTILGTSKSLIPFDVHHCFDASIMTAWILLFQPAWGKDMACQLYTGDRLKPPTLSKMWPVNYWSSPAGLSPPEGLSARILLSMDRPLMSDLYIFVDFEELSELFKDPMNYDDPTYFTLCAWLQNKYPGMDIQRFTQYTL